MAKMQIVLNNRPAFLTELYADGNLLTFKKRKKSKRYAAEVETENTKVELVVKRHTLLQFRLWWFWEILFYILSVFGMFDIHGTTKNICQAACRLSLPAEEGATYTFTIGNAIRGKKVLRFNEGTPVEEKENLYYLSPAMEKRRKGLKAIKVLCPILLVIGLIIAIIV